MNQKQTVQPDSALIDGPLGATMIGDRTCRFLVWAPRCKHITVVSEDDTSPALHHDLQPIGDGYFADEIDGITAGFRYFYLLDNSLRRPDPASRSQPAGVHGPTEIVDDTFQWTDHSWNNPDLSEHIFYELHVGTFTRAGTLAAIHERLPALKELGVTAIELMPIAQFPGSRNWGYDGVAPYAVQNSYGGMYEFKRLVNAAHAQGIAVYLDVVYNHLGPEGNYLANFGYYFTDHYRTPWGDALNFDGPHSDHVRRFFLENVRYWLEDCHIDGLRLDALHAIVDNSAIPFIEELTATVDEIGHRTGRTVHAIAESASNDSRILRPRHDAGAGMDAQWSDDYHHIVHTLLTGESDGYYTSYQNPAQLKTAITAGYVYTGEYSAFHKRRHGRPTTGISRDHFVVFAQNHDQIGNRRQGERLASLVDFEVAKLAAALVLFSPFVPLLFMGDEYAEPAPFLYFVSHSDPDLIDAVRHGRREEFASFGWSDEPPDPQAHDTFDKSRLHWELRNSEPHRTMLQYYKHLIALRRQHTSLSVAPDHDFRAETVLNERTVAMCRSGICDSSVVLFNVSADPVEVPTSVLGDGLTRLVDSADAQWSGPGSISPQQLTSTHTTISLQPWSCIAYWKGER